MARERYLVGVDPEELKKREPSQTPQSPRSKWENFWYYYKWWVIGIAVALVILGIPLIQALTAVKPDHIVFMVTTQELGMEGTQRLEDILTAYATDVNGDGKVKVQVRALNIGDTDGGELKNPFAEQNRQAVTGELAVRECDIWAVAPSYYNEQFEKNIFKDDPDFLLKLDDMAEIEGISEAHDYWNWESAPMLKTDEDLKTAQKPLYWCVRGVPKKVSEKDKARIEAATELLKAFAKDAVKAE